MYNKARATMHWKEKKNQKFYYLKKDCVLKM